MQKSITKARLFKYIKNFTTKNGKFSDKRFWYFMIFLLKTIDCGYSLEPPRREYPQSIFFSKIWKILCTPVNPSFTILNLGLRGSKLYRRVFVMHRFTFWFCLQRHRLYGASNQKVRKCTLRRVPSKEFVKRSLVTKRAKSFPVRHKILRSEIVESGLFASSLRAHVWRYI